MRTRATSLEFNRAVNALAADNDVVVDDLGFFGEPANGQSTVSVNTAAALNNPEFRIRTYVTSVGNAADDHYLGTYVDSRVDGRSVNGVQNSGRLHLYQRTAETSDVLGLGDQPHDVLVLPKNGAVVVVLTWDDPAGRSANNYDLYLVRESSGQVVARSTDAQRGSQDPIEFVDFVNREGEGRFRILIQNVDNAAAPRQLNVFSFQPQCASGGPRLLADGRHERHNYNTPSRSLSAQSDAGGTPVSVISVGAVCSASAAAAAVFAGSRAPSESCNDRTHQTIQYFSSRGPTLDGRMKPDISANRRRLDHWRRAIRLAVLRDLRGRAARGRHRGARAAGGAVSRERDRQRAAAVGRAHDAARPHRLERRAARRRRAQQHVRIRTRQCLPHGAASVDGVQVSDRHLRGSRVNAVRSLWRLADLRKTTPRAYWIHWKLSPP